MIEMHASAAVGKSAMIELDLPPQVLIQQR